MTVYSIPLPIDPVIPQFTHEIILEGISYKLRFNYNGRESLWYLSLLTAGGEPISEGMKLVLNIPLLRKVADSRRPGGELYVIESDSFGVSTGQPPGLTDFGTRVELIYIDKEQINEIIEANA